MRGALLHHRLIINREIHPSCVDISRVISARCSPRPAAAAPRSSVRLSLRSARPALAGVSAAVSRVTRRFPPALIARSTVNAAGARAAGLSFRRLASDLHPVTPASSKINAIFSATVRRESGMILRGRTARASPSSSSHTDRRKKPMQPYSARLTG